MHYFKKLLYPRPASNRYCHFWQRDFKSRASTNSATRAIHDKHKITNKRAGNETRTRDPNLGKVVLYQLSYSRVMLKNLVFSNAVQR